MVRFVLLAAVFLVSFASPVDAQLFSRLRGCDCGGHQRIHPVRSLLQRVCHRPTVTCGCAAVGVPSHIASAPEVVPMPGPQPQSEVIPGAFGAIGPTEARGSSIGDRFAFRRQFLKAARQARNDGKIDARDAWNIEIARWIPGGFDKLQESLAAEAVSQGYASAGAVDWDKLLNFLNNIDWQKIMDFISMLMKLFAWVPQYHMVV